MTTAIGTEVRVALTERQQRALADLVSNCTNVGAYFSLKDGKKLVFLSREEMEDLRQRLEGRDDD